MAGLCALALGQAASQTPPGIRGCLLSADGMTDSDRGLYLLPVAAGQSRQLLIAGPQAMYGGTAVEGVYYCNYKWSFAGFFTFYEIHGYDLTTGERVFYYDEDDTGAYFTQGGMALDPVTDSVIGLFYNSEMTALDLALVTYGDQTVEKTVLAPLAADLPVVNAFAVSPSGRCYALTIDGDLYGIDRNTGRLTLIGATGMAPEYTSGAVMDTEDTIYWAVSPAEGPSMLVAVDTATGACSEITPYPDRSQWAGLYTERPEASESAPGACQGLTVSFAPGETTGSVTLTTPATLYGGSAGSGPLEVHVLANGRERAREAAGWGEDITLAVDLGDTGRGMYDFTVYASNPSGNGPKSKVRGVWVGADLPSAPEVTLQQTGHSLLLEWQPVTTGIAGTPIDPAAVTYDIYEGGGLLPLSPSPIATGLETTSYRLEPEPTPEVTSYAYTVYAMTEDLVSSPGVSNTVVTGSYSAPYAANFADDGLENFTVIDSNRDGITWGVGEEGEGAVIGYSTRDAMDDWLISPPVEVAPDKAYEVTLKAYARESYYNERLELRYGYDNTAEAMAYELTGPVDITVMSDAPYTYTGYACSDCNGRLFVGIHGISDADRFELIVSELAIATPVSSLAPGAATDFSVAADPDTYGRALIGFMAPDKDLAGRTVESLARIDVAREGTVIATIDRPDPGMALSLADIPGTSGEIAYTVTAYNSYGRGATAMATAYIGYHAPQPPAYADISRTETPGEAMLSWGTVSHDTEGNAYPAGSVTYTVYREGVDTPVAEGLSAPTLTYRAVAAGEQEMVSCRVSAVYGNLTGESAQTPSIPVGTPYDGLDESGEYGRYVWGVSDAGGAAWGVLDDSSEGLPASADGDGTYFGCQGEDVEDFGVLFTGLVSLENLQNPGIRFATYQIEGSGGSPDLNELTVSLRAEGDTQWTDLYRRSVRDICGAPGSWGYATVPLSDYEGEVVQVQFTATCKTYLLTLLDAVSVGEIFSRDLAAAGITAPGRAVAGAPFTIEVGVDNIGSRQSGPYEVELYADGLLADSRSCPPLDPGMHAAVAFTSALSPLSAEGTAYYGRIVMEGDENPDDNTTGTVTVALRDSNLPAPTGLTGSCTTGGVELTWTEPVARTGDGRITEDFEDAGSFACEYGDWTFTDADRSPVGGMSNTEIPGITNGETLGSFWIWDTDVLPIGSSAAAHSGSKYLFSLFCYNNSQSDEWAISPRLDGSAQTVSFWAKSYSKNYLESIQVLASTTGIEISHFEPIESAAVAQVPAKWTKYSVSLPEGTAHFAIRSVAAGAFMLMVDDVSYIPLSGAPADPTGYDVYRDGTRIATLGGGTTAYTDTGVEDHRDYTYCVTALYGEAGVSAPSAPWSVFTDFSGIEAVQRAGFEVRVYEGCMEICNPDAAEITVCSADGTLLYASSRRRATLPAAPGLYLVSAPGGSRKVMVR